MTRRGITLIAMAAAIAAGLAAGPASAGYYTSPRFLVGLSQSQVARCAGGDLIARSGSAMTYRSVGTRFHRHVWRHRPPELSIPGGPWPLNTVYTPTLLHNNRCDVTFRFRGGRVSGVEFRANVRGTQAEFTCGIVTDHCLP